MPTTFTSRKKSTNKGKHFLAVLMDITKSKLTTAIIRSKTNKQKTKKQKKTLGVSLIESFIFKQQHCLKMDHALERKHRLHIFTSNNSKNI